MNKKRWMCLILAMSMMMYCIVPTFEAEATETTFNGTYEQVKGFFWDTDGNTITFNSADKTFFVSANMYEGFYEFSGTYTISYNQAFCTVTDKGGFYGKTFTMTDINGNLIFEADNILVTITTGALFKNINATVTPKLPWEDAYMSIIKSWKNENSSFNFALYDVDEDTIPELFIASYGFYTVYTYRNGECVDLGTVNAHLYQYTEKNSFLTCGGMGTGIGGGLKFKIENGELSEGEIEFFYEWPFEAEVGQFFINGQFVSQEEYYLQEKKYTNSSNKIYEIYCDRYVYIPDETRLSDYVTMRNNSTIEPPIKVKLDGKQINFDQPPILDDGRTLVPVRAIFEALGATVKWNQKTQTITAQKGDITILMQIGNKIIKVGGSEIILDVAPKIVNNRTLVPVRAVAEGFRAGVDWEQNTKTVYITSDFYDLNVNNLVKNKAYSIFSNPTSDNGYKVWEFNHKDDLNMTEKQYKDYVYLTSIGSTLLETGVDISNFDFVDLFGNNNKKEYLEDAITKLLVPTEEEVKTLVQKNLEGIGEFQNYSNNTISFGSDLIDLYKEVQEYKGINIDDKQLIKDVGGELSDKGLSAGLTVSLASINDTITELILLKTIADTYDVIGNHYEQFINNLSSNNAVIQDKALLIKLSKEMIQKQKNNTKQQIISAMISATTDNAIKEAVKWLLTNGIPKGSEKITYLKGTIAITITKLLVSRQIDSSKAWLAFAGMNSIQKLAASEYEILLNQAKVEKGPISSDLQAKLKNAALVYIMSSIKCRNLLLTTVDKSQIIPNNTKLEPLKNKLETRNNMAYQAFNIWKNVEIVEYN